MRFCMFVHSSAALLAGLLSAYAAGQTFPRGYESIAITDDLLHQDKPRMNDSGQIVFHSGPPSEPLDIVLYQPDGTFVQITNDDIRDAWPDIANDGTVVWTRWIGPPGQFGPTGEIMMRTPDGQITRLTDNDVEDNAPRVNSSGMIAWKRYTGFECGLTSDIWMFDGDSEWPITNDSLSQTISHQDVELNELNELVWTRFNFCDSPWTSKIMMYSDGKTFELTDGQQFPQAPALNNLSQVVFDHYDPGLGLDFIDLWENGRTTTIATDGIIAVINDRGDVAFDRWDDARSHWDIWLYRDAEFFQITRDAFDNIVPDINNASEICWGANTRQPRNIHCLRRFDAGDLNCDGALDAFDIEPFIFALFDPSAYLDRYSTCDPLLADTNGDGAVDAFDIEPFLGLLFP